MKMASTTMSNENISSNNVKGTNKLVDLTRKVTIAKCLKYEQVFVIPLGLYYIISCSFRKLHLHLL